MAGRDKTDGCGETAGRKADSGGEVEKIKENTFENAEEIQKAVTDMLKTIPVEGFQKAMKDLNTVYTLY